MENKRRSPNLETEFLPEIRRARLDKLTIYEISELELSTLERGSRREAAACERSS